MTWCYMLYGRPSVYRSSEVKFHFGLLCQFIVRHLGLCFGRSVVVSSLFGACTGNVVTQAAMEAVSLIIVLLFLLLGQSCLDAIVVDGSGSICSSKYQWQDRDPLVASLRREHFCLNTCVAQVDFLRCCHPFGECARKHISLDDV